MTCLGVASEIRWFAVVYRCTSTNPIPPWKNVHWNSDNFHQKPLSVASPTQTGARKALRKLEDLQSKTLAYMDLIWNCHNGKRSCEHVCEWNCSTVTGRFMAREITTEQQVVEIVFLF